MGSRSGEDEPMSSTSTEGEKVSLSGDTTARGGEEREGEEGGGDVDPDSPNSKTDSTSSSSEGVLVEHPVNADQAHEPSAGHRDTGVFVNIDGSMQENPEGEDGSREDSFVDAPDDLGYVEGRSSGGLEESMAMIEIGEHRGEKQLTDEVNRLRALLAETLDECARYKGEHELLGREIGNIQYQLKAMTNRKPPVADLENLPQSELDGIGEDSRDLHSSMPLYSVLRDCSKLASQLGVSFDEQLQWEGTTRELRAALDAKDQEIEDLNEKLSEFLVSRDVVASYVDSLRESSDAVMKKLSTSLSSLVQDHEVSQDSAVEESTLVEKKTLLLIDRYAWFHYETEKLGQYLYSMGSKFVMPHGVEIGHVFEATHSELLESRTRETYYSEKTSELEKEKGEILGKLDAMDVSLREARSEASNAKKELDKMEQKFVSAKEKLSIAVNKGKSLVQNRDSLKHRLTEKSAELEKCLQELKQKSDALEAAEQSIVQLNQSQDLVLSLQSMISEKDNFLGVAEKTISQSDLPEGLQSRDIIEKIKWLIDQRKVSESILTENNKLQHALASSGLPGSILSTSLESQINWLGESFSSAREDLSKMQDEIGNARDAFESCQSELLQARNEIEHLKEEIFVEKQQKDSLHVVNEDLTRKFESMVDNLSRLSMEKNRLMRVLRELSQCTTNEEADGELAIFIERCVLKIKEKLSVESEPSSDVSEWVQRLEGLLYDRNLDLAFCETILEEEMSILSDELHRISKETESIRNERNSLHRALEEAEDKYSFIREKLSMAVKKGKGLVQEREGLKQSLEEKNSEIDKLKHELKLQESKVAECKEHIAILTSDLGQIDKMESDIMSIRDERDQFELLLQERNSVLQKIIESIEEIGPSTGLTFDGPVERVKWITQHVFEVEAGKTHAEKELERLHEEVSLQANKLSDAFVNIRSLEDALSEAKKHISVTLEGKEEAERCKSSIDLELRKVKEVLDVQTSDVEQAYNRVNSLEEGLLNEKNRTTLLLEEKNELELKRNQEIMELNIKLSACMEELEGKSGSLKNQSAELNSQFRYLLSLTKPNSHLSLATELFRKNVNGLRNMASLLESIHDRVSVGGLEAHHGLKQVNVLAKLHCLPEFEEYINDKEHNIVESMAEADHSFTKVAECVTAQSNLLDDHLTYVSCYINDQITLLMQVAGEISDYIVHILKFGESCKQNMDKLEASNKAQETEISSLQNDLRILQSACSDAIQVLPINLHEILDQGHLEQDFVSLDPSEIDVHGSSAKHLKTAEILLHVSNRIRNQIEKLSEAKNIWLGSIDDLKSKLQKAELSAESAYQERDVEHERFANMEAELKTLQNFCSELKSTVEDYKSVEVSWKEREKELASLQMSLIQVKSRVEDYQSQELIWKDKEKELASLQNVCSKLKSIEENYQSREVIWKEKEKELASLQSFCIELKSAIEDYQSKEVEWNEKEKELASLQNFCSELKSMVEDYQAREAVWKKKDMELNSLQGVCSELKALVEDYRSREVVWKDKEKELASLQHELALKDRQGSEKLILESHLATLFEKLNRMKVPFAEVEVQGQEPQFSSAMDSMLYILSGVDTLQNMMDELTDENKKLQSSLAVHADETKHLKKVTENLISNNQDLENRNNDLNELTTRLVRIVQEYGGPDSLEDKKPDAKDLLCALERLIMTSLEDSEHSKLRARELGAKLLTTEKVINELSAKVKSLEDSRSVSPETKERGIIESSSSITASEISEVDVVGPHGKGSLSHPPAAALRPTRKGSSDHIALYVDTESDRLIGSNESEDKGHAFKSLNTSGLVPKQGKLIADRVDSIWVSGSRLLMSRPGARIGVITYWILLHLWVLATIL